MLSPDCTKLLPTIPSFEELGSNPIAYVTDGLGISCPVFPFCGDEDILGSPAPLPPPFEGPPSGGDVDTKSDDGSESSFKSLPLNGIAPWGADESNDDIEDRIADAFALVAKARETKAKLDALSVAARWLVDTGCGKDLISLKLAQLYRDFRVTVKAMTFGTANGTTEADQGLPVTIADFDDDVGHAYILNSTPPVLSVGERCMHKGFCFFWVPTKRPCMVTPSMIVLPLEVKGDIPYLGINDIKQWRNKSATEIYQATGVFITHDFNIRIELPSKIGKDRLKARAAPAEAFDTMFDSVGLETMPYKKLEVNDASVNTEFCMPPKHGNTNAIAAVAADLHCELAGVNGNEMYPALPAGEVDDEPGDDEGTILKGSASGDESQTIVGDGLDSSSAESSHDDNDNQSRIKDDKRHEVIADHDAAIKSRHCLIHRPFRQDCHACRLAKTTRKRHTKWVLEREVGKWGELMTCDHIVCHNWMEHKGLGGKKDVFTVFVFATSELHGIPANSQDTWDPIEALQCLAGDEYIHVMYADRDETIDRAVKYLHGMRKKPELGNSSSNGVIENLNRRLQEAVRAALIQAGLPICWWSYAVQHWCFLRNTAPDATGISPYEKRHGEKCKALPLPFGVGVYFSPNKTKYKHQHKFQSRFCYGIIVGFGLSPGHVWDGTDMVVDVDHFVYRSLDEFAEPKEFTKMKPHCTYVIKAEVDGFRFPLAREYERCNRTLEGRREYYNDAKTSHSELSLVDYSPKAECNRIMREESPHRNPESLDAMLHDL